MTDIGYIAYLDEAGDFGLKHVAPIDASGASEWLVMGAVVVRAENERHVPRWLAEIRKAAKNTQSLDLHFRKITKRQKHVVCVRMTDRPMRLFVVISNKQNMRRHRNQSAAHVSQHRHWFYWWLTRLLLERVTDFCAERNEIYETPGRTVQIEFSRRSDLKRNEFTDYFTRLWAQGQSPYLAKRQINWSVFDFQNIHFFDHQSRAGLQFADVAASAFFQAVNTHPHGDCAPEFAKLLKPLVNQSVKTQAVLDEGFTIWPIAISPKSKKRFSASSDSPSRD